jgi:hypothetical protein
MCSSCFPPPNRFFRSVGGPSIQFNSTITNLRFGLCLAAGYSVSGLGLKIQGRFVLLHPVRRPRQAGRFDVSSLASSGAIFKFRGSGS